MKKSIYFLLCMAMVTLLYADGTQPPGSGTSAEPYQVSTLDHLLWISTNPSSWDSRFQQTANIDASETAVWNPNGSLGYYGFSAIGNYSTPFTGVYNGLDYNINGLYINRPTEDYCGLFGYVDDGTIKNLTVKNAYIRGNDNVAALAGYLAGYSVINNCHATGTVTGKFSVGGLVGEMDFYVTITNSHANIDVSSIKNEIGGLVGMSRGIISNSYAKGSVEGTFAVGGLVGYSTRDIQNCYAIVDVSGSNVVGGLLGWNNGGSVAKCYSAGSVTASDNIGGLVGENEGSMSDSFYDTQTSGCNDTGKGVPKTTAEMKSLSTFLIFGWDFEWETANGTNNSWDMDYSESTNNGYPYMSWQDGPTVSLPLFPATPAGDGTSANPYQISNLEDLVWIGLHRNQWDKKYIQTANIDASAANTLNGQAGLPVIGNSDNPFSGLYNGQEYRINNLTMNYRLTDHTGLFGYIDDGTIKNLTVKNAYIRGNDNVAALAGYLAGYSVINNCHATGTVTGQFSVGGLVGEMDYYVTVTNSHATIDVSSNKNEIGGLVGMSRGIISNSYAKGSVEGAFAVGGLVGYSTRDIQNCYAIADVSGNNNVGGLLGWNNGGSVAKCYSAGSVSSSDNIGGLVGESNGTVNKSFYDSEISGLIDVNRGIPKSTAEMKTLSTFTNANWDFERETANGTDEDWDLDYSETINSGYPYLSWQDGVSISLDMIPVAPAAGDGSSGDPYQISTLENLLWVSQNSSKWDKYFILIADIDASESSGLNNGDGFSPIGTLANEFTGSFDGLGFAIDNLNINRTSNDFIGLFGFLDGATIKNIALTSAHISGGQYVGGIAGVNSSSTITQCYTKGSISGTSDVGGVTGSNNNCTVRNCYSTADVSGTSNIGGLTGGNTNSSTIDKCYARGSVSGSSDVGGLVGANSATVTSSFFDGETTGQSDNSGKGEPRTTKDMQAFITFFNAGWDLEVETGNGNNNIWDMDHTGSIGGCYPYLSWQDGSNVSIPDKPASGDGSSSHPYQIASLSDLAWVSLFANKWDQNFVQTANIDASATDSWLNGAGFSPIGNSITEFTGAYNGLQHTISGLTIDRSSTNDVGVFGYTSGATLENIAVINADITGNNCVGGLVGNHRASSTISKCYATGNISGNDNVGGIAGVSFSANLAQCYSMAGVNGASNVGGLVGFNYISATAQKCYARGNVSGASKVGGLIGRNAGGTVSRCYATGHVSGPSETGGLVGDNVSTVSECFYDQSTTGCNDTGKGEPASTTSMKIHLTFTNWDFATETTNGSDDIWDIDYSQGVNSGYPYLSWQDGGSISLGWIAVKPASGDGSSGNPYQIATLQNLAWLSLSFNNWDKHYIQTAIIDAAGTSSWNGGTGIIPVGNSSTWFTGSYDGQSFTINGLTINKPGTSNIGLFGYTNNAVINNLGLINANVTGLNNVGGLIGDLNSSSTVKKCYTTGSVSGNVNVGGLAGINYDALIGQCYSNANVSGSTDVGGLVGSNQFTSDINNCYARGSVSGTSEVGGLAGSNVSTANLNKSYAIGSVNGSSATGGLVGTNSANVTACFYDSETTGQNDTGKGIPKSTADMKLLATFTNADWDFEMETTNGNNDFWDLDCSCAINQGYPFLSWFNGEDVALPVELYSFTATCHGHAVILEWVTESETDNLGYIIERQSGNSLWQQIASFLTHEELTGSGTTTNRSQYTFEDNSIEPGNDYTYRLSNVNTNGESQSYQTIMVTTVALPSQTELANAYPNPFNPQTTLKYQLAYDSQIVLTVYDVLGRQVKQLVNQQQAAGEYSVTWDGTTNAGLAAPSGAYLVRLQTGTVTQHQKILYIK